MPRVPPSVFHRLKLILLIQLEMSVLVDVLDDSFFLLSSINEVEEDVDILVDNKFDEI